MHDYESWESHLICRCVSFFLYKMRELDWLLRPLWFSQALICNANYKDWTTVEHLSDIPNPFNKSWLASRRLYTFNIPRKEVIVTFINDKKRQQEDFDFALFFSPSLINQLVTAASLMLNRCLFPLNFLGDLSGWLCFALMEHVMLKPPCPSSGNS